MNMNKADNVKDMRKAGNAAIDAKDYEEAIRIYSQALLPSDIITDEEKSLLHSNRSYAYLLSAMECGDSEAKLALALQDANEVIKIRPTWWKGYFRAGEVHKFKKEWNLAIDLYDEALALNPELVDVKNCRDECRIDKLQAEMHGNTLPHGFQDEVNHVNEVYGVKFTVESIIKKYEESMKSKNPKDRAAACVFFGVRHIKGVDVAKDIEKGVELLQEAADAGSPQAMIELAILHMEGNGVQRNIKKAVNLFEKAAQCEPKKTNFLVGENDGTAHAQFHIGLCFENGTGKPLDYYQARQWYKKASERGHAGAANNMAILYLNGFGGAKCSVRAKQFFSLSASRGNTMAMESLAWQYLEEKDFDQAESWYLRALESGNEHSMQHKEKFYKMLDETRNWMKEMKSHSKPSEPAGNTHQPDTNDMMKLVEALERATEKPSIAQATELAKSPLGQFWTNFEEIKERADSGYPFAQTIVQSMSYFAEGRNYLEKLGSKKMSAEDTTYAQEQCIHNFANCFRETEIVAFFEPSQLSGIMKLSKSKISNRTSDLDLAARVVYCNLLAVSQNSEMLSFSRICCQMYPNEVTFYKMTAAAYAVRQNFEASMKVSDQGLERFPENECLLYCKAGAMKMIDSYSREQVIAAYNEFIKHAPFDERMMPEVYYIMAFYSEGDEQTMYYQKGLEAERQILPCLLPYQSKMKSLLDAMVFLEPKNKNGPSRTAAKTTEKNLGQPVTSNKLQLTNPARLQCVQRHRQTLKSSSELTHSKLHVVTMSIKPQKEQKITEHPDDFKEISLRDMNPYKDALYEKRFINLLISEDPMFGLYTAIHVVVRDDNGDCLNCSFYELDHSSEETRRNLCFGSKITVLNPYYRLASDGSVALRVDDPKTVIYRASGKDNPICRYCWKENPQHSCGDCKRAKYCSRTCQTDDWKILKHKLICGLKYLDGM